MTDGQTLELLSDDVKFLLKLAGRVVDYSIAHDMLRPSGGLHEDTKEMVEKYNRISKYISEQSKSTP